MIEAERAVPYFKRDVDSKVARVGTFQPLGAPILYNPDANHKYYLNFMREFWHMFGKQHPDKVRQAVTLPKHAKGSWDGVSVDVREIEDAIKECEIYKTYIVIAMPSNGEYSFYGYGAKPWNDLAVTGNRGMMGINASIHVSHLVPFEGFMNK